MSSGILVMQFGFAFEVECYYLFLIDFYRFILEMFETFNMDLYPSNVANKRPCLA